MRRVVILPFAAASLLAAAGLSGCGSTRAGADGTLPPMRTTTTTTTTTTTPDNRRKYYEVEENDNLAYIADLFDVPPSEIVRLNDLKDGGAVLHVGQMLEIPTDVVIVAKPSTTTSTTT